MTTRIAKIVAVLTVGLAVQVGMSAAATDSSGSSSGQALRGRIVIDCSGVTGVRSARKASVGALHSHGSDH